MNFVIFWEKQPHESIVHVFGWKAVLLNASNDKAIELKNSSIYFDRHEYAVAEKNTVLATCRKLEEQLENRGKQIQQ